VAYDLASRYSDRIRTLTAVSAPHPAAWRRSLVRSTQSARSAYMAFFQLPWLPERLLASGSGTGLRRALVHAGLSPGPAHRYAARATEPGGITGPLNWYRAALLGPHRVGSIRVPTVLLCGDRDPFITGEAIALSRHYMLGPFRSEMWSGASHWIPDEQPERLANLILSHLRGRSVEHQWSRRSRSDCCMAGRDSVL